jgi:hypothetical protein
MPLQRSIAATTTPVRVEADGDMRILIQNLGAGDIYIGPDNTVSSSNGIKVVSGGWFETPAHLVTSKNHIWIVSDTTADVRIMRVG